MYANPDIVFSAAPTHFRATLRFTQQQRVLDTTVNSIDSTAHLRQNDSLFGGATFTVKTAQRGQLEPPNTVNKFGFKASGVLAGCHNCMSIFAHVATASDSVL